MTTVLKRLLLGVLVLLVIGGGVMLYFYYLDQTRPDRQADTAAEAFATYLSEGNTEGAAKLLTPGHASLHDTTTELYFADFKGSQHTLVSTEPLQGDPTYSAEQNPQVYLYAFESETNRSLGLKYMLRLVLVSIAENTWRVHKFSGEFIRNV